MEIYLDFAEALRDLAHRPPVYIEAMHEKQRLLHEMPDKKKAALWGRRAGKSGWLARWFAEAMDRNPGAGSIYMTTTRGKAREIMWDNGFSQLKREFQFPVRTTTLDGQLRIVHENGAWLWLLGIPDKGEINKVRGGYYCRAAIDEAQAFPDDVIRELIEDALIWALMDLDGDLALTGTPSPTAAGYFYEVTDGIRPGYGQSHATVFDNPFIPEERKLKFIAEQVELLGGEDSPTYQREVLGKWVNDPNALIYPYEYGRNGWVPQTDETPFGLPKGQYRFGLGIDLGWDVNSTALTLGCRLEDSGLAYLIRSWKRTRLSPQALLGAVESVRAEVKQKAGESTMVVIDEGALGSGFAQHLRENGVQVLAAKKTEKRAHQEWIRGLILAGSVKAHFSECADLIDECRKLPFDPETGKEDERYVRHSCDSQLYLLRHLVPRYNPELETPQRGTKEWLDHQAKEDKRRLAEELQRRKNRKWA